MKQDLFQALADPTHKGILTLLAFQAFTPNALSENFERSRQAVTKLIKVLQDFELIRSEPSGKEIYCPLNSLKLEALDNRLAPIRKIQETQFNQLNNILSTIKNRKK